MGRSVAQRGGAGCGAQETWSCSTKLCSLGAAAVVCCGIAELCLLTGLLLLLLLELLLLQLLLLELLLLQLLLVQELLLPPLARTVIECTVRSPAPNFLLLPAFLVIVKREYFFIGSGRS